MKGILTSYCVWGKTELEAPYYSQKGSIRRLRLQIVWKHLVTLYFRSHFEVYYSICKSSFQEVEILNMNSKFSV